MGVKLTNGTNPDRLDQVIKDLGVRIKIFRSCLCPNLTSLESLDHDPNCQLCNNSMIDFDPKETIALFQQQDLTQQFKVQGTFHIDEILMTFLAGQTLQQYTRIELIDFAEDFFELIQRQEGVDIDRLKYPACCVNGLFSVEGGVQVRYYEGADFQIDVNGDIKWVGAHKPSNRKIYSIYYKHRPVFRAIKAVHRDRYSQYNLRPDTIESPHISAEGKTYVKLQETWIVKRDYLLERRNEAGTKLSENTYYNPNEEPGD